MRTVEVTITISVQFRVPNSMTQEQIRELAWLQVWNRSNFDRPPEQTTFTIAETEDKP